MSPMRYGLAGAEQGLALAAPAKLNLSLAVTGRRRDGLHELASVLVLLELADRLALLPGSAGLRLHGATEGVPVARGENLAWRGLVAGLGTEPALSCLELEKRIPVAAGLGGGSSDAAAAWRLGRALAGRSDPPSAVELADLAPIGADVPFFAAAVPAAYVTGAGERVEAIPAVQPAPYAILVIPPFGLPTGAVFGELREGDWSREPPSKLVAAGRNDLLAAARRLRPELDDIGRLMAAAGTDPHLTGSGPTLFAASDDSERLAGVATRMRRAGLGVIETRLATAAATIESEEER